MIEAITVIRCNYMPYGLVALVRDHAIIWLGDINAPWEDVECDSAIVSERDYDELLK